VSLGVPKFVVHLIKETKEMVTVTEPTKTNPNWTLIMTTGKRNYNESVLAIGFKTTFSFPTTYLMVVIFLYFVVINTDDKNAKGMLKRWFVVINFYQNVVLL
jgi:hypothetical protein